MKKTIVIATLIILLTSCGIKRSNEKTVNNLENKYQIHTILKSNKSKTPEELYGKGLARFIKTGLTSKQESDLLYIIKERKEKLQKIKKILLQAQKDGNFDEKYKEAIDIRKGIRKKLLPFIKKDKLKDFDRAFENGNVLLKKIFG